MSRASSGSARGRSRSCSVVSAPLPQISSAPTARPLDPRPPMPVGANPGPRADDRPPEGDPQPRRARRSRAGDTMKPEPDPEPTPPEQVQPPPQPDPEPEPKPEPEPDPPTPPEQVERPSQPPPSDGVTRVGRTNVHRPQSGRGWRRGDDQARKGLRAIKRDPDIVGTR